MQKHKKIVCSPEENIVTRVLQRDTLVPYFFIICLDVALRTSTDLIKNVFTLQKARSWRYPTESITDADYADDLALLTITPVHAESLLHSVEKAEGAIVLYGNLNITEFICFKRVGSISTLSVWPLKLVDKFITSMESHVNILQAKRWISINKLFLFTKCSGRIWHKVNF